MTPGTLLWVGEVARDGFPKPGSGRWVIDVLLLDGTHFGPLARYDGYDCEPSDGEIEATTGVDLTGWSADEFGHRVPPDFTLPDKFATARRSDDRSKTICRRCNSLDLDWCPDDPEDPEGNGEWSCFACLKSWRTDE